MKKIFIIAVTMITILGATTLSYGANFMDIKATHWAYEAVNTLSEKAIVKGYPDGNFKPNNTVTYGEFIKMALVTTGEDVGNSETGNWATKYYDRALELGYFTKYDIEKANLNEKITRAHMALIISAILGDVKIDNYDEIQKGITDITYKTDYEYDITKAYATGILTGYTDNTFRPEKTLSRAESAAVIYRLEDESKRVLPGEEKETQVPAKETISVTYGTKTLTYNLEKVQLGYGGIEKIEVVPQNGRIAIYSTIKYEAISVFIDDKSIGFMGFTSGLNYYTENGYYIYLANPSRYNVATTGKTPTLNLISDGNEQAETIYKFTDVIL